MKSSRREGVIRGLRRTERHKREGEKKKRGERERETRRHNVGQKKVDGTFSAARRRFVSAHNRKIMRPFFALAEEKLKLMRVAGESETYIPLLSADDRRTHRRGKGGAR